jgi:hypothetical protein
VKIPRDPVERQRFYDELTQQCLASRSDRFDFYRTLRNYYLFGSSDESGAPYNKIGSTIDTLASFVYAPDAVRFAINIGVSADPGDAYKAAPLARELTEQWRMSGTHLRFGLAAKWSLVFGAMLLKVQWKRGIARTYMVEPHQFGVLREDIVDLADQEAFVMCYSTTKTQLGADLAGNPRRESILARVNKGAGTGQSNFSDGMTRLLLSNPVGGVPGSVAASHGTAGGTVDGGLAGGRAQYSYAPRVEAELVDMVDLYVWNDDIDDYQIVSMASPSVVIYDRPQKVVGVAGIPHFAVVRAESNLYDYFWGDSFAARLAWLQEWRTEDVANIRNLQKKQSDPPISGTGMTGIAEEKLLALRRAGGSLSMSTPTAKVQVHAPTMPTNIFGSLAEIDAMFDDTAGIGHILQGKGEAGVRSKGQADLMARLGSSRPKMRAIVVEESAEDVATLMLRNVQENSDQKFQATIPGKPEKLIFAAAQFTKDYEIKVDAHSSSPIFVEDRKHDAITLLEAKAIDRETFLDMFDPPNRQLLQERLKVIEAQEAKAQQMQAAAQAQAHGGKPAGGK